jgi:glycerol-3-phosphate dehydrogenase (NAD(P)+)
MDNASFTHLGILGAGAWGTALAQTAATAGRKVALWAREPEVVDSINAKCENSVFLPGLALDPAIRATSDLQDLAACDAILCVVPTQFLRATAQDFAASGANKTQPLVICAKGIEQKTLELPSTLLKETLPDNPLAVLSGPTFAAEVARGLPTAITLACEDAELGAKLVNAIGSRSFRPYLSEDLIGAQVGGAIKNVLAIACGIAAGSKLGENARAALITRGLAEMRRLGLALGAKDETLMGLSGLGDLVLTCGSLQSRNMSLGFALGEGKTLDAILGSRKSVAEGVWTASAATRLAEKHKVEMPIASAVDAILNRSASVEATIASLLARPWKAERA